MRVLKHGSLASRLYIRLKESPVPVRTSILIRYAGTPRSHVWAALSRMEKRGEVIRSRRVAEGNGCRWGYVATSRVTFWSVKE